MDNIIVLSQNVQLHSLKSIKSLVKENSSVMILSTQFMFENERELVDGIFETKCIYKDFSDYLTDKEREACDHEAFDPQKQGMDCGRYYADIKILKNKRIIHNLLLSDTFVNKIIVADDLGIEISVWLENGFELHKCIYYYTPNFIKNEKKELPISNKKFSLLYPLKRVVWKLRAEYSNYKRIMQQQINVAYKGKQKYLFYGALTRIGYRIDLNFKPAGWLDHFKHYLNCCGIFWKNKTIRLSSFHEGYHLIPDRKELNVKLIQDGYLPPNYSSRYFYFYGKEVEFYTWDEIGTHTFQYHNLPYKIMPIRKKILLPTVFNFPQKVKKVLCASSGTGDWTAIKNRSDDDKLLWAMGQIAKAFPEIEFIYRCHPTWVHPSHAGVNSINRCIEYISWLNLPNLKMSCNIPPAIQDGQFVLSYKRSSFEEDLKGVDIVFGEHSVAMLDAGLKGILFASCNMTGHRPFYEDINKLGFPHCESVEEIANLLRTLVTSEFKTKFLVAVDNYNQMTNRE